MESDGASEGAWLDAISFSSDIFAEWVSRRFETGANAKHDWMIASGTRATGDSFMIEFCAIQYDSSTWYYDR